MSQSPPPSPSTLIKAQLLVEKGKRAQVKSRKSRSSISATATAPKAMTKPAKVPRKQKGKTSSTDIPADKENLDVGASDDSDGIAWAKNPGDTSRLIGIIEDSLRYRQAFGLKGGGTPGVTSGGLTTAQVCHDIGEELFPGSSLSAEKLGKAIGNRIQVLKKLYGTYHKSLGETGHGLIIMDHTEDTPGTPISNVWDKMRLKFPWYKRMHMLLCGSPVYDSSALANSGTVLDIRVLNAKQMPPVCASPDWDEGIFDDDTEQEIPDRESSLVLVEKCPSPACSDFSNFDISLRPAKPPPSPSIPTRALWTPAPKQDSKPVLAESVTNSGCKPRGSADADLRH
ncbi:hypothetical protein H0H81_005356 [Sphagnurus paluster]|uniref:Uncharacterized protein n=1 Tax=Sphagnurus paluster TaxID=117069 RepID=A0A9P7FQX2_9AGAR|nr:hypothetical protein H0H81_005356 [Sphagnurus paluster]